MTDSAAKMNALPAGTVIDGRYRLVRRLGRGGFAWVYEGQHVDLERSAAIKVLSLPEDARDRAEFVERFLREARIVARLSHPNVITVYDFGVAEHGEPYIAMELLHGHDLEAELLNHGPLDPRRAKALFLGALDALRVAHQAGIVHKDLKPSNLFVANPGTPAERLVLLDFGIAWVVSDDKRITKLGAFTGTPAYAAPEYVRTQTVSPAIDVYQIGLILSEALTGVPAVTGAGPVEIIMAHAQGDVEIPAALAQTPLGQVILRATAFEAADRYADGGQLAVALSEVDFVGFDRPSGQAPTPHVRTAEYVFETVEETVPWSFEESFDGPTDPMPVLRGSMGVDTLVKAPSGAGRTTETAAPQTGMRGLLAVAVIVTGVVGVLAWRILDRPAPPQEDVRHVVPAEARVPEPRSEPADEPEPTPLEAKAKFTVRSNPSYATVYSGDRRLGVTPFKIWGDEVDGSEITLRFEMPEYESVEVQATLTDGGSAGVDLVSTQPAVPVRGREEMMGDSLKIFGIDAKEVMRNREKYSQPSAQEGGQEGDQE